LEYAADWGRKGQSPRRLGDKLMVPGWKKGRAGMPWEPRPWEKRCGQLRAGLVHLLGKDQVTRFAPG